MKKLIFALAMVFSFALVSCGSKNVETETEIIVDDTEIEDGIISISDEVVDGDVKEETPVVE
jgi:uncharacterized protein YcfL